MDLVVIPHSLFVFYGGLVLVCGGVLGFIAGRNAVRRRQMPTPPVPDSLERRVALLEQELDASNAELTRLVEEREFLRELREPPPGSHRNERRRLVA